MWHDIHYDGMLSSLQLIRVVGEMQKHRQKEWYMTHCGWDSHLWGRGAGFSFTNVLLHAWYTTMITIFYYVVVYFDIIHDRNNHGASPCKHGGLEERMKWPNVWQNERKLPLVFNKEVWWCWIYGRAHLWNHRVYASCVQLHLPTTRGMSHKVTGVTSDILPGEGATSDKK